MSENNSSWDIEYGYDWAILHCPCCTTWFQVINNESDIADYVYCPKCGVKLKEN